MMAVAVSFGHWVFPAVDAPAGERAEGLTHCWECDGQDDRCSQCSGTGQVEFEGSPQENLPQRDFADAQMAVLTAFTCRERAWSLTELLDQPAKWVDAYRYILPFILREVKAKTKELSRAAESAGSRASAH